MRRKACSVERGVPWVEVLPWTATSRTEAFQALRARIYTGRVRLYDDGQLVQELLRLRSRYRAGSSLVEVPRVGDSHGDEPIALAAAVWEHDRNGVYRTAGAGQRIRQELDPGRERLASDWRIARAFGENADPAGARNGSTVETADVPPLFATRSSRRRRWAR